MQVSAEVTTTFNCSRERAFKAPILGDATKFLGGYLFQPPVTAFEDDATWGNIGGVRYPVTPGNFFTGPGRICKDEVLERKENEYWKWTIYDFNTYSLYFATKAIGEWFVRPRHHGRVDVTYRYTYYSRNWLLHPLNWLFMRIQMKGMMQMAIIGIKAQAESNDIFIYEA